MNRNSKIAVLVISCLQGGGAERVVLTLGQGFYDLGYEVHILRFKPLMEYERNPNLNYHLLRYKPYKLILGEPRRNKIFARAVDKYVLDNIGKPDIILSNLERADSVLSHSKLSNIVYVIHNTLSLSNELNQVKDADKLKTKLIDIYSKHPCVCVSRGVQEDFIKNIGRVSAMTAIHNPIDRDNIQRLAEAFVPDYQNYIIHVGSFKRAKRHDVLLKAYAQTDQSMSLLLLGQGKYKKEMQRLAIELNIQDKVVFLGFRENPFPFIKHAQFKVLTSDWEGFALVIAESLALGTPVISTDCPSGPSELLPEKNLMPMNDVDAIADKLNQAMRNPQLFSAPFDEALLPVGIAEKYIEFAQEVS